MPTRSRPRTDGAWAMTITAVILAAIAAITLFTMLHPTALHGLGGLGSFAFLYSLQLLPATAGGAGLAIFAWRRGSILPASVFALAAALSAVIALWPSFALWRRAEAYHVGLSLTSALIPRSNASSGPQVARSVVYGTASDGTRMRLDVWRTSAPGPGTRRPAIVRLHGGAWIRGARSGRSEWDRWLNRLGYDVFDVDYRLPPPVRWRSEVGDVKCALGWVVTHAGDYNVDPARISVMGYSAGANLAMLAAYSMGDARLPPSCPAPAVTVRSAINLYGPADLGLLYRSSGSRQSIDAALRLYIGGSPAEYAARYRALSPLSHIGRGTPPTITVLGESDRVIPTDQARVLDLALTRAGIAHRTYLLPAQDHSFDANWSGFGSQIARAEVKAFLVRYG